MIMTMTAKPNYSEQSTTEGHCHYHTLHMDGAIIENSFPRFRGTIFYVYRGIIYDDGFRGLVVSMLASGTRVREFNPGRSRWIFPV
jgi:hypothetical protein